MKKIFKITLCVVTLCVGGTAWAAESEDECHTPGTSWSGDPGRCNGEVCVTAFRLRPTSATVTQTNGYGAEHDCYDARIVETSDDGWNTRVTKMCAAFHAKSPSGMNHHGERGTVRCRLSVESRDN